MDEFVQFGWAKYIPDQIGAFAANQVKAEGYAFFFYPAHLIGWDARSMLLLGRMEMALLACGTLAIVYASARALGESRARSALIVLILLSFSNFIERIFETRGDPLSVFFAAAALLVAIRGRDRGGQVFAAGVLSGLAFLSTQKAVYFNFALGAALVGDAALDRRFVEGVARGAWLVLGWLVPIVVYCVVLGGGDPLAVGHSLFFGPAAVMSPHIAGEYGGLEQFVVQTLVRNALLYLFCFAGMVMALLRIRRAGGAERVALIFSAIVTALVFAHNQPWPYVFIMALPFMALWALRPFDALAAHPLYLRTAWAVLAVAVAASFVKNVTYLRIDNRDQLALVDRAEALVRPGESYFDGVGMLPNRREPSTLWLDRHAILLTLAEGRQSDAWRIFATSPPKLIIWTYRMDNILPVVLPLIRDSYVKVAPNVRMAGVELKLGQPVTFDVPVAGTYALYDLSGKPLRGRPLELHRRKVSVTLRHGPAEALLLPEGSYAGRFSSGADNKDLFAGVYG
jgi:Dolichyl-phosphate-mannose-protein mannosyltransferase